MSQSTQRVRHVKVDEYLNTAKDRYFLPKIPNDFLAFVMITESKFWILHKSEKAAGRAGGQAGRGESDIFSREGCFQTNDIFS